MEHAVIVHFKLSDDEFGSFEERERAFALEDRIEQTVAAAQGAEYDGHEIGSGWCRYFCYGTHADELGDLLIPLLREADIPGGSFVIKRYGPPGARELRVSL